MRQVQYWARVRARADCPLRRGAWYRVVDLTPVEALVDVNHRLLHIPRAFVQVLPLRPPMWSVVPGPRDSEGHATAPDRPYGVCPACCGRAPLQRTATAMRCPRCGTASAIAWSDSPWRAFEVIGARPSASAIARARASALKALATAFGLRA